MKAVVYKKDTAPRYGAFADPVEDKHHAVVQVTAAALTNLDIAIATGRHYFSIDSGQAVVGREAVVHTPGGERFFLGALAIPTPFGSMAERALADMRLALPVSDGVSDEQAAALGNAGLAGWLPLSWRAGMKKGEQVLILGATGTAGRIAVAAAKLLGARRVVAVGRNAVVLEELRATGADDTLQMTDGVDLGTAFQRLGGEGFDVVVDYLNGPPAEAALQVMAKGGRMVQVGSTLSQGITLHAQTARRASLDVLGFAYYHAPIEQQAIAYQALCKAANARVIDVPITTLPMADFADAWDGQRHHATTRYVLRP